MEADKIDIIIKVIGDCWWVINDSNDDKSERVYQRAIDSLHYVQSRFEWYESELAEQLYHVNEKIEHVVSMKDWLKHAIDVGYLQGQYVEHLRYRVENFHSTIIETLSELELQEKEGNDNEKRSVVRKEFCKQLQKYHELLKALYEAIDAFHEFVDFEYSVDDIFAYNSQC